MRPLSATETTCSTLLSKHEIHANDCEIFSEQEIKDIKKLATGESLRPPFVLFTNTLVHFTHRGQPFV